MPIVSAGFARCGKEPWEAERAEGAHDYADVVARPVGTGPEAQAAFLHAFTLALSDALTVDDVARVAVSRATQLTDVGRVGLALRQAGGRELSFVSSDQDALTPTRVAWCSIDGFADVPLTRAMRLRQPLCFGTWEALDAEFPHM